MLGFLVYLAKCNVFANILHSWSQNKITVFKFILRRKTDPKVFKLKIFKSKRSRNAHLRSVFSYECLCGMWITWHTKLLITMYALLTMLTCLTIKCSIFMKCIFVYYQSQAKKKWSIYRICPNRSTLCNCSPLGAHLFISALSAY